jgi:hypothetical protein
MTDARFVRAVSAMQTVRELAAGLCVMAFGLLIFFLFTAREAHAADMWGVATLTSYHFDRSVEHNERNLGLGLERGTREARLIAGFYDNSNNHLSLYAGAAYTPVPIGEARFGLLAGVVNGYKPHVRRFGPLVAPTLTFDVKDIGFNIIGAPRVLGHKGVIALQIKAKF